MKNLLLVFHILLIFSIVGCAAKPKVVYVGEKKRWGTSRSKETVIFSDGTRYVGEFREGKMVGLGIKTNRDGSKFDGDRKSILLSNHVYLSLKVDWKKIVE